MNRTLQPALWGLILLTFAACKGPELKRLNREQAPVRMSVGLPSGLPDREKSEAIYQRGLAEALSKSFVQAEPNADVPLISVAVAGRFSRASIARDAAGTGLRVGSRSAFTVMALEWGRGKGALPGMGNGALAGVISGITTFGTQQLYNSSQYNTQCKRLGYEPSLLKLLVYLVPKNGVDPELIGYIDGIDVLPHLRPLSEADRNDPEKRLEEEGRAIGLAVWGMLIQKHSIVSREFLQAKRS